MPKLEVLVGMIASGKSTYALSRAREGALIVSHDDLTEMLHGEYRYEQGKRDLYRKMEESLVRVALSAGHDVVVDRTHLTRESRKRWLDWAAFLKTSLKFDTLFYGREIEPPVVVAVAFPTLSAEHHARRRFEADARGRPYEEWLKVAEHHAGQARLEPLELSEGFDRIEVGKGPWDVEGRDDPRRCPMCLHVLAAWGCSYCGWEGK